MKRIPWMLLSTALLCSLAACSGTAQDLTEEEIQAQLEEFVGQIPSAEANSINLSQSADGYSASLDMTWTEETGRYSTEKSLEAYSSSLAEKVSRRAPNVSGVSISWTVPYHSETEPSMAFTYARNDGELEQSELQDRFIDGTFGADAFLDSAAPAADVGSTSSRSSNTGTSATAADAIEGMHLPRHKTIILPVSHAPRHKSNPAYVSQQQAASGETEAAAGAAQAAG